MPTSPSAAPPATADDESLRHFGVTAATAVMVGNMIGTGVFTALGFQAQALHSGAALLSLWAIGGLIALCGALAYAELGTMYPHCGGEYVYLGRAWHPMAGFLGGCLVGIGIGKHKGVSIRRGLVHGDTHVVDHADDVFHLLRI